jgi:uridine kinase/adenylate cyclase class IV
MVIDGKKIPLLLFDEGIAHLASFARERMEKDLQTMMIGAAKSSSGKGFVDKALARIFGDDLFGDLDLDFYYFGNPWMEEEMRRNPEMNWDHPGAVELSLAAKQAFQLKDKVSIMRPNYSKKTARRGAEVPVDPKKIMTVSGNYGFFSKALREAGKLLYFILASKHSRIIRRLLRDKDLPGWTPESTLEYMMDVVEPMADRYIVPDMKHADIIICNDLISEEECKRAGMFQQQLKFPKHIGREHMRRCGAERLLSGCQTDTYYTCSDHDVLRSDMFVRIRNEGEEYQFSMKGPKEGTSLCERPKFEYSISPRVAKKFASFYGDELFKISKGIRTVYTIDGVIVVVDRDVTRHDAQGIRSLGNFTEVRFTHDGTCKDFDRIIAVAEKLGLSMSDAVAKAYGEI